MDEFFLKKAKEYYDLAKDSQWPERRTPEELRKYARGLQDVTKYQYALNARVTKKGKDYNKLKWNISWQPLSIWPKFRNIIKDKITSLILEPSTEAIDENARIEKIFSKNLMKLASDPSTVLFAGKDFGVDQEEVEYLLQFGGIRLAAEILMKDGIDLTLLISKYPELAGMVAEDIIDLGRFGLHVFNDNGKQKVEYVDPARPIIRNSIYPDHRDSDYRGFTWYGNALDLKKRLNLTEEEFTQIKKSNGIPLWRAGRRDDYSLREISNEVEVCTIYFLESVPIKAVVGMRKNGAKQFELVGEDFKPSKSLEKAGKRVEEYEILKMYKVEWIVNTKIIRYEEVESITRNSSKEIQWPVVYYDIHEPSLTEKIIGFDDDIQIANFKLRQIIAKIPPAPRMIVYKSLMEDSVDIAGDTYSVLDMVTNFQSEGIMVLGDKGVYDLPGENGTRQRPIDFYETGVAEDYNLLSTRIIDKINEIRQISGVNEVADGTSTQQDMLQSVMQNLAQATNSALSPYVNLYIQGFQSLVTYIAHKYQSLVAYGDIELGVLPIEGSITKMVALDKSLAKHDWGIKVIVQSREYKQMLIQKLMSKTELDDAAFFAVSNMIIANDLKKAQFYLSKYTEKARQLAHEQQVEIAQATAQGNANAAVATEEARRQTLEMEMQFKNSTLSTEFALKEKAAISEHQRKLIEMREQNALDTVKETAVVRANNQNRLTQ